MRLTVPPLPITVVPFINPGSKTAFVVDASTACKPLTVGASWIQSALQRHDEYVRCLVKDLPDVTSFTTIVHLFPLPCLTTIVMASPGWIAKLGMATSGAGMISVHA